MTLEQVALQVGGGALIGYITGGGLKRLLRIIIKIVAIVLAGFFAGLLWLQVQKIVMVNWKVLEKQKAVRWDG